MDGELKVERALFISAPAARVWEALITPEQASAYFAVRVSQMDMRPGGKFVCVGGDGSPMVEGIVSEVEPMRKLVHSWTFHPFANDPPSRVTYELEDMGEMCKLTMTHDGFATATGTYRSVTSGWDFVLSNLKSFVETGRVMPWPADMVMD